jgi:HSP20 family protein
MSCCNTSVRTPDSSATVTPTATRDNQPSAPARIPAVSVHETADAIVLLAQVPGVSAEDAQIAVDQGVLTLRGSVKTTVPAGYAPLYQEYVRADFARSFTLPPEIDAEHISAQVSNGVLRIDLPKVRAAQPRRIAVKAG